jgi:hypothetical protein
MIILLLGLSIIAHCNRIANAKPQYDTIIFYMVPDTSEELLVNQTVNVTLVFKNFLANPDPIYNISTELFTDAGLNFTNVFNTPLEDPTYNQTDLFIHGTNSTPIFYWNSSYCEMSWAQLENNESQILWFELLITDNTGTSIQRNNINYILDGEEETLLGSGLGLDIKEITNTSAIPVPYGGEWVWYWWFIGSVVIATPLIAIVITRLTLWKR